MSKRSKKSRLAAPGLKHGRAKAVRRDVRASDRLLETAKYGGVYIDKTSRVCLMEIERFTRYGVPSRLSAGIDKSLQAKSIKTNFLMHEKNPWRATMRGQLILSRGKLVGLEDKVLESVSDVDEIFERRATVGDGHRRE